MTEFIEMDFQKPAMKLVTVIYSHGVPCIIRRRKKNGTKPTTAAVDAHGNVGP